MVAGVHEPQAKQQAADNNAMDEAEMTSLFEAAMKQQQQKDQRPTNITQDEQTKFLSAMKDPEFRSLLNDYMQEISDPRNRAETEQYLSQLENEQKVPADKQLIKPTPGFVVKTKWDTQKVFVNVCSSDKLQPPSSTKVVTGQQGTSWNLPYSLGPERLEPDKGGASVPTFDVCFHPRVIEFSFARADYKSMVVQTCLDAVETAMRESRRQQKTLMSRNYHVLKGVAYKSGDPVTMCLKKEIEAPRSKQKATTKQREVDENITVENAPTGKTEDSVLSHLTHVEQAEEKKPSIKEVSTTPLASKQRDTTQPASKKMEHQLIYRGRFELLHHMQSDPDKTVPEDRYRPKELVVEVSFPLSSSAKGLDLDVSEKMLRLSAGPTVPGDYEPLELTLPYPVIEDKGSAKFDRKNHKLVVTLPVQPPPKSKPQSVSLVVEEESDEEEQEEVQLEEPSKEDKIDTRAVPQKPKREEDEFRMLRETAEMVANDPQVLAHTERKAQSCKPAMPKPVVTEPKAMNDSTYDDLPPLESCSDQELEETTPSPSSPKATEPLEAIKPPFTIQDTPTCLSYLVGVADIDSASVKLTFPTKTSLHLQFSDRQQKLYDLNIAALAVEIDPTTAEFDVASENMVVILQKKDKAPNSVQLQEEAAKLDVPEPAPLAAARFQNQLLYELD